MRLLKSVEEFLYELVTWVVFYPLTFMRAVRHPIRMMSYAVSELTDREEAQYDDALSPPIFLLLTLLLTHLVALGIAPTASSAFPAALQQEPNQLILRASMFSLFPLLFAMQELRSKSLKLTRDTLRPAFYSQCYVAAPFIAALNIAVIIGQDPSLFARSLALGIFVIGLVWYLAVEIGWSKARVGLSTIRAVAVSVVTMLLAFVLVLALGIMIALLVLYRLQGQPPA